MTHRFRLDDGIIRIPPWDYSAMRVVVQRSPLTAKQRAEIRPWAEAGYADSQYLLACGDRLKASRERWLLAAADQGHPEACFDLYCNTNNDNWLNRAVELAWPPAQHLLATMLAEEEPYGRDLEAVVHSTWRPPDRTTKHPGTS